MRWLADGGEPIRAETAPTLIEGSLDQSESAMRRAFARSSPIDPLLTLLAVACSSDRDIAGPGPEPNGPPAELLGSAIRLRVDMQAGKVTIEQPSVVEQEVRPGGLKPSFALLGQNEVTGEAGPMTRSAVGAFTPGVHKSGGHHRGDDQIFACPRSILVAASLSFALLS